MVYVLHVKKGYEERLISIEQQMEKLKMDYRLMLDGDMEDINEERLNCYFSDKMKSITPETSCALKHLLVYEDMQKRQLDKALILEDDIILYESFNEIFVLVQQEITEKGLNETNYLISYENSGLKSLKRTREDQGRFIFKQLHGRCTGAYSISQRAASAMLELAKREKVSVPVDWWHNYLAEKGLIDIYWCEPSIAEQGSHSGKFSSAISHRKKSIFRNFAWEIKKLFKKLKYAGR